MKEYVKCSHSYVQISYHIVLVPKYRRKVFADAKIRNFAEIAIKRVANHYNFEIFALKVMHDHVHLFVGCKPTDSISKTLQLFKGISARMLLEAHPELRQQLWGGHLWSRGTFVRSVGSVTSEAIENYILESSSNQC